MLQQKKPGCDWHLGLPIPGGHLPVTYFYKGAKNSASVLPGRAAISFHSLQSAHPGPGQPRRSTPLAGELDRLLSSCHGWKPAGPSPDHCCEIPEVRGESWLGEGDAVGDSLTA